MSDLMTFDTRTSQELESEKTALESRVSTLQTKSGADTYIADRIGAIEPKIPQLSSSMAFQCGIVVGRMKAEPAKVVTEEISKLEARIVEVEREIKPLDPIIKEVK